MCWLGYDWVVVWYFVVLCGGWFVGGFCWLVCCLCECCCCCGVVDFVVVVWFVVFCVGYLGGLWFVVVFYGGVVDEVCVVVLCGFGLGFVVGGF